jgi:hypothetical protein
MNLAVFVTVTILFVSWLGNEINTDRSLLIFEYALNTIVNVFTLFSCCMNIYQLRSLFDSNKYQSTSFDCIENRVVSPMNEV